MWSTSVTRPLMVAHAASVEAVAEPVQRQKHNASPQGGRDIARNRETHPDKEHRDEPEPGKVVGIDPRGQTLRQPDERPALDARQQPG
jgi:hypothetical protein